MKQFFKYTFATILGVFVFSVIVFFLFMGVIGSLASMSEATTAELKPNSVYVLDLTGTLQERSEDDPFAEAFAGAMGNSAVAVKGLDDVLANIQKAKNDVNVIGIYLKGGQLNSGYASKKEIRDALLDFKTSGKFVAAYADNYGQANYYLATVADTLLMNAQGMLDWRGLYSELEFFKNTLDKLGIEMQIVKVGTYKSAVEPYVNTKMSDANREQIETYLHSIWGNMVAEVSASRGLSSVQLNEYADEMMAFQEAEKCVQYGLVDALVYEDQVESAIKACAGLDSTATVNFVKHSAMCKFVPKQKYQKEKVAVIYATGGIQVEGGDGINSKSLVKTIDDVAADESVKSVVLRVNSPGGSAYASEQIWRSLVQLKAKKPLIVSMGDYAASGGYYISCMADSIVAQPNTLTGSIGIFGTIPNISGLTKKVGISFDGVQTNKMSNMETNMILRGMNGDERALMQAYVNRGYELFVKRCADGRGMSVDAIKAIAEGRVWTGEDALEIGLVDEIGGLQRAVEIAANCAGLSTYRVAEYPAKKDFVTKMLESMNTEALADKIARAKFGEQYDMLKRIREATEVQGLQAVMPYVIIN